MGFAYILFYANVFSVSFLNHQKTCQILSFVSLKIMDKLLVDGYVKDIEKLLTGKIIPIDITHLISSYYCMLIRLLCLHFPNGVYISDVNNRHPMKSISWKSKIISLTTKRTIKGLPVSTGICTASHIQLPSNIKQKIFNINSNISHNKFDVVFQCSLNSASAIIFDRKQFETVPDQSSMQIYFISDISN